MVPPTGTGASQHLIESTYLVSSSCFVVGNACCIANLFVPKHHCFCLPRHHPFVWLFADCSDRLHLVQYCCIIHNFLSRFLTLLLLCSSFTPSHIVQCFRSQFKASSRQMKSCLIPLLFCVIANSAGWQAIWSRLMPTTCLCCWRKFHGLNSSTIFFVFVPPPLS